MFIFRNSDKMTTPDWKVGDPCRAVYTEDSEQYEVSIESIEAAEDGNKFANVVFVGYGNKQASQKFFLVSASSIMI